ncbi:MAG: DUF4838 domain-containing protein [Lentisphaeria bacterium]|nr:DUF4838 domain-containing protein [Lentisphaeria bacterium]
MKMRRLVFRLCSLALAAAGMLSAQDIIRHGQAVHKGILVPAAANSVEQTAAGELQYYLQAATGVLLPIISEDAPEAAALDGGYCLGAVRRADPWLDLGDAPACAYKIRCRQGFLFIRGQDGSGPETSIQTAAGTLFGVTDYLMQALGVRWVFPGKDGEFVPRRERVAVDASLDRDYAPALRYQGARTYRPADGADSQEKFRWGRRVLHYYTGGAFRFAGNSGHAFEKWHLTHAGDHPEWFCLINGKRKVTPSYNMCISNAEFQDEVVRLWQEQQQKSPGQRLLINVKENDNQNRCQCPNCQAWDGPDDRGPTGRYATKRNVGERYAHFYRAVQEKAARIDPTAMVGFYAYQTYFFAPRSVKLNAGCFCDLVPDIPFPRTKAHTEWLRREYQAWKATGATFGLRPNYFLGGYCMPEIWYDEYIDEFKYLLNELKIIGLDVDGPSAMFGTQSLNLYAMGRIAVDPSLTAEQIRQEYLEGFGSAAPVVAEYTDFYHRYLKEHCDRINKVYEDSAGNWYFHGFNYGLYAHEIFPPAVLEQGIAILDRGLAALGAGADAAALVKVRFLRQGLEHALATVRCAALVTGPKTPTAERNAAVAALREGRQSLPAHLVREANLLRAERRWEVNPNAKPARPEKALAVLELPEIWKLKLDPRDEGEAAGFMRTAFDASGWQPVSTWRTLEVQGHHDYQNAWFRTSFRLEQKKGVSVSLFLGAIDESCKVWVNGQLAGSLVYDGLRNPRSWENPFEIDVTKWVQFEADNDVVVKVINRSGAGGLWKPSFVAFR